MTKEELVTILEAHKKWLSGSGGKRADLRSANLRSANLYGANLRSANLYGADLRSADLRSANLYGAALRSADLRSADLRSANLYGAALRSADLRRADLRSANLYGANLRSANLYGADLRSADLRSADLYGATVSWQSHAMISRVLLLSAGDNVARRSLAGLIAVSEDWCWDVWTTIDHPEREWALGVLKTWVKEGDGAPEILWRGVAPPPAPTRYTPDQMCTLNGDVVRFTWVTTEGMTALQLKDILALIDSLQRPKPAKVTVYKDGWIAYFADGSTHTERMTI